MPTTDALRALPASEIRHDTCSGCHHPIVWATTVAGPNGPGGKWIPLDPLEDLAGNIAVTEPTRGSLRARALQRDEQVDRPHEYAGMPHFATCRVNAHPEIPTRLLELRANHNQRRRRGHRHGGARR